MAAYAALNGWHPIQYAYWGTTETRPAMINSFEVMLDPTQTNLIPAASLLFQRGDVRQAEKGLWDVVPPEGLQDPSVAVERHPAVAMVGRYGLALPGIGPAPESDASLPAAAAASVRRATTGELTWDTAQGLVTIDTPRTQAVVGFAGGRAVETGAVRFEIATPFAVVAVSSLDGRPISESGRLLVSTSADARWTGVEVSETGDRILSTGRWPFLMQPVEGRLLLKVAGKRTVYRLATNGARLGTLAAEPASDGLVLALAAANGCMHYEVVGEP
jgi:hypothetical protein